MMRSFSRSLFLFIVLAGLVSACATSSDVFNNVGDNIASVTAMSFNVATNRMYVVNSNSTVLYDWTQGSFQVYDVTAPLSPVLLDTTPTLAFSGQVYIDTVAGRAYMPNRYTATSAGQTDLLYTVNIDEASADFMTATTTTLGLNSYAISCCYPAGRAWVTTMNNELQYVDLAGDKTPVSISLLAPLDNGSTIGTGWVNEIVIVGNMAYLSCMNGGVIVVNLDSVGVAGVQPVNYFIYDINIPRGMATDGRYVYVVAEAYEGDTWTREVIILDSTLMPALAGNTTGKYVGRYANNLQVANITVGNYPQNIALTTDYGFVTNQQDNTVSVIDLDTRAVTSTINVGNQPFALSLYTTLLGVDQYMYVSNLYDNTFSIIDIPTLAVVATVP